MILHQFLARNNKQADAGIGRVKDLHKVIEYVRLLMIVPAASSLDHTDSEPNKICNLVESIAALTSKAHPYQTLRWWTMRSMATQLQSGTYSEEVPKSSR